MVNPDVGGILYANAITIGCKYLLTYDIAYNNVRLFPYE